MKNKNLSLNVSDLPALTKKYFSKLSGYKVFIFFMFVALIYGYIVWRVNTFSNTPPDPSQEAAQISAQPHIDADTVEKIQSLQDHSVSVQSLFDTARQNPFNE